MSKKEFEEAAAARKAELRPEYEKQKALMEELQTLQLGYNFRHRLHPEEDPYYCLRCDKLTREKRAHTLEECFSVVIERLKAVESKLELHNF
jgi:hypothetical protein